LQRAVSGYRDGNSTRTAVAVRSLMPKQTEDKRTKMISTKKASVVFGMLAGFLVAACSGVKGGSSGTGGTGGTGSFSVGGSVTGLSGTGLVLMDNGTDVLPVTASGPFTFLTSTSGTYAVTVQTQPSSPAQT
jgi:hypothetical protein